MRRAVCQRQLSFLFWTVDERNSRDLQNAHRAYVVEILNNIVADCELHGPLASLVAWESMRRRRPTLLRRGAGLQVPAAACYGPPPSLFGARRDTCVPVFGVGKYYCMRYPSPRVRFSIAAADSINCRVRLRLNKERVTTTNRVRFVRLYSP